MKLLVLLTQYKRNNLEKQLIQIKNQTIKPDYIVVFQNENHVDISELKEKYNFIHMKSDYNTKFFGRFAACFTFPVDICIVFDDDIIPGNNCINNYINQCIETNGIIGGNGRMHFDSIIPRNLHPPDIGTRKNNTLVDFVGHLWCFKKEWLYYMFSIPPYTYDTGEDMHLCFSSKLLGGINSYTAKQINKEDMCDIYYNKLASDEHSSFKKTSNNLRKGIQKHFVEKYDFKFIDYNNIKQ
tara:strand:+ start:257 stop:976 length:720 start_codon:yes stop_codon:yes gene_type:complete